MTTTERDTSSLNYDILVRRQGRCGITIIGGIGSTYVVVVGIPAIKIKVQGAGNGNKNNNNKNMNKGMRISMTSPATKGQCNFDTAGEQEDVRIRSSTMSLITYYHIVLIGLINMNKGLPVLF